jgi:hydroxypyruvate isomerase
MPKFSAHLTQLFTEAPFAQRFGAASRAGFRGCEFRFPFDYRAAEVAGWLSDAGLKNVLFNARAGDWAAGERGIAAAPGREAEFRESVHEALDYARALSTPAIHVMAGNVPFDANRPRCRETFVESLKFAAREAARSNVAITIEPLNTQDLPNYFLTTQAQSASILQDVAEPNLRMQLDLYHAQINEGDLAAKIRRYLPHIGHIQVASVPGRHEPDDGEINYPYLFRLLDELGYDGWVGCEYVPRGDTALGLGWMKRYGDAA